MSETAAQALPVATRFETWITWAGRLLSVVPVGILLSSAHWKLTHNPWYVAEWARIGYAPGAINGIGLVQLACAALYVVPQTAMLGTVLLTGYLGGAIASYVRIGEPYPVPVPLTTCLLAWAGLYLRDRRLRALLPFRRKRETQGRARLVECQRLPSLQPGPGRSPAPSPVPVAMHTNNIVAEP